MKKRLLCFGDSNTWGYIPGSAERYSEDIRWPSLLASKLGSEYQVIEEGLSGRTTLFECDYDEYLNGKKALGFVLKSQQPLDCVVLMLGTNDLPDHHIDRVEIAITELIRNFKNANYIFRSKTPIFPNGVKLLLISPLPFGKSAALRDEIKEESKLFPKVYKRVAELCEVDYLDPTSLIEPSDVDGIHFTPEAHKALAAEVYKKLMEMNI